MKDYIIRGITKDKCIRFFAVKANQVVSEAMNIHQLSYTNAILLGRTLIAGLLMSNELKNEDDLLTIRFIGEGPAGHFLITCNGRNSIKGYCENPGFESEKGFKASEAVGPGIINVIKSIGTLKPYIGQTNIISGEIAEDLAYYYMQSEQIPTAIQLGVLLNEDATVKQAGGFLVQLMPDTPEHIIDRLEKNINGFPNFSDMLDMNYSLENLIEKFILKDFGIDITEKADVRYECNCNKERFEKGLSLLGKDELQQMIDDNESINADCHFCNKTYNFTIDDLKKIYENL